MKKERKRKKIPLYVIFVMLLRQERQLADVHSSWLSEQRRGALLNSDVTSCDCELALIPDGEGC